MDGIFNKLGGRKFSMGIVLIVAGAAVDIMSPNGLSVNLLGLMTAIYAAFSASNSLVTVKQMAVDKAKAEQEVVTSEPAPSVVPNQDVQKLASELLPVLQRVGEALDNLFKQQAAQSESISTQSQALGTIITLLKK